jgi:hypothetical protein
MEKTLKARGKVSLLVKALSSIWSSLANKIDKSLKLRLNLTKRGLWSMRLSDRSSSVKGKALTYFSQQVPRSRMSILYTLRRGRKVSKGLYYLRTNAGVSADKVGASVERNALKDFTSDVMMGKSASLVKGNHMRKKQLHIAIGPIEHVPSER